MKRSKHSLSQYRLTSLNQGELYPVLCEEVLPGDSWRQQTSVLLRVSPLVAPVMHPVELSVHSWFVPARIVWDNWEKFITGADPSLVIPTTTIGMSGSNAGAAGLARALGVGADSASVVLNALPFRAYNLIWNEFYRDPDLDTLAVLSTGNGPDDPGPAYAVRRVRWEKDYFTTARPYPQQGSGTEVVQLSLTGDIPVKGIGTATRTFNQPNQAVWETDGSNPTYANAVQTATAGGMFVQGTAATGGNPNVRIAAGTLISGGMDINAFRKSMAMQRMREHRNRFGSRYRDMLAFLGVNSSDARLQRPEYLGGGKQTVSFSEVLATAETTGQVNVGDMAGHGIAAMRSRPFKRFMEEHGYVLTFLFVRPKSVYVNRVPRHFLRRDYEHYWQKELEMMGEQEITNFEIYGDAGTPAGIFGYIPRFDEYRHGESSVSGEFRSLLDYWHMARKFTSQPALNTAFVECTPTDRIYASTTTDELYAMVGHRIAARRLVSKRARS